MAEAWLPLSLTTPAIPSRTARRVPPISERAADRAPALTYVLPLRWERVDPAAIAELTDYLAGLRPHAQVLLVDGSPAPVFDAHAAAWGGLVQHMPPDPAYRFVNGKVNGVLTGVFAARHNHVIIADDDVRHTPASLAAMDGALATAAVVRPQNYFAPLPWHARWDTARILLNRAMGADYPGTLGIRRSVFVAMGGYDGDVLFENLELIRTIRAHGGREIRAGDLYIRRLPPETHKFWQQRVRQAYDEFAQPGRMLAFLAILPATAWLIGHPRRRVLALAVATALAEVGRRRDGGRHVFPASSSLLAPVWLLERGIAAWLAVGQRIFLGGVRYAGRRITVAGHHERELRRPDRRCRTTDRRIQPVWPGQLP
jgi:hypothetical protein